MAKAVYELNEENKELRKRITWLEEHYAITGITEYLYEVAECMAQIKTNEKLMEA